MKKLLAALLALFLISSVSYAGFFSFGKSDELLRIFETLDTNGPDPGTVEELENYVERNPRGDSVDEALLRLGRIHMAEKDFGRAEKSFQKIIEDFPSSRFKPDSMYELGRLWYMEGRLKDARGILEPISSDGNATLSLRARAEKLIRDIDSVNTFTGRTDAGAVAIGALLPLKGDYAQFGEDALKGILLAAGVFGDGQKAEVIVRNVGVDPVSAANAVNELSDDPNVAGLVGPLISSTAFEAASSAQKKKIPVITLSQKENVTGAGDYVFRNFLIPGAQASSIADYAIRQLGRKRFGVLYPQNNYGSELAKLFEAEVKKRGGEVVREVPYEQGNTDFSAEIKRLFGIQVKEHKDGRRRVKEYNPTVNIDALYIPDFYDTVSLIAPYLGYYNIKGVQLLGSNGWNSPKLIEQAGKDVEGAVFVDGFFPGSARPGSAEFTKRFRSVYGRDPGVIEAQAYDAAMVLISAAQGGGPDREALRQRLNGVRDFQGATGVLSFGPNREAVKKLFILTITNGRIVEAPGT